MYKFVTIAEIDDMIKAEEVEHETSLLMLTELKKALLEGDTVFHNDENDKWFLVKKGNPIPKYLENEILGR